MTLHHQDEYFSSIKYHITLECIEKVRQRIFICFSCWKNVIWKNCQLADSIVPYQNVSRVQFRIWSPNEIRHTLVTNPPIEHSKLMEGRKSKKRGLMDPRQGLPDRNSKCKTCARSYIECPEHFGHMDCEIFFRFLWLKWSWIFSLVTKSIYHVAFLSKILKVLRCVCFHCSKFLIDANILDIMKKTIGQPICKGFSFSLSKKKRFDWDLLFDDKKWKWQF